MPWPQTHLGVMASSDGNILCDELKEPGGGKCRSTVDRQAKFATEHWAAASCIGLDRGYIVTLVTVKTKRPKELTLGRFFVGEHSRT